MLWLELEGAVNARDIGGIPTNDGGKVARGKLLRSDNLQDLSPADIAYLRDEVGLTTVVDLRSNTEVNNEGPGPLRQVGAIEHVHHSFLLDDAWDTVGEALATRLREERERYEGDRMCAHYLGYVEKRPDSVVGALRTVTNAPGAALVHCAAGKDRTGVLVAFALTVAGAERDAIVRDYAITGERITAILDRLRASETYASGLDRRTEDGSIDHDRHTPRAETMAELLDVMDSRYGGVVPWLGGQGFTDDELTALHDKLRDGS